MLVISVWLIFVTFLSSLQNVTYCFTFKECCSKNYVDFVSINHTYFCKEDGDSFYVESKFQCREPSSLVEHKWKTIHDDLFQFNDSDAENFHDKFCMSKKNGTTSLLVCIDAYETRIPVNEIISITFLLITITIYSCYSELRNLMGKCILSSLISQVISFLFLCLLNVPYQYPDWFCVTSGYFMYFWFLCTFFWQNVISFHIWKASMNIQWRLTETQMYIVYSAYAWVIPSMLVMLAVTAQYFNDVVDIMAPGIGENSCWFKDVHEKWFYFVGPLAIVQICNLVFFTWICINFYVIRKSHNTRNQQTVHYSFAFYYRMFIIMGLYWSIEILSFSFDHLNLTIFRILDYFNRLQGVFIFVILCVRKPVLSLIFPTYFRDRNDSIIEEVSIE